MRETRVTSDCPRALDAPPIDDRDTAEIYETRPEAANGGFAKDSDAVAALDRYLDALLDRERAIPLSEYGRSFRELSRGVIDIFEHARRTSEVIPSPRVIVDATGKRHLAPEWRAFDPGLAREIRYQARAVELAGRYGDATPSDVPRRAYRGVKAGRKIVGQGRPTERSRPTFYLPRRSELGDTLSADSNANTKFGSKYGTRGPVQGVKDADQWDTIAFCVDLARAVALGRLPVEALARLLVRLRAPESVETTCFDALSHTQKRKLRKALRAVSR